MNIMMKRLEFLAILSCFFGMSFQKAATAHTHEHVKHRGGGERETDGAFSPRIHEHQDDERHDNAFDHEAIIGSAKEAQEFDDLPPEEAKRRLRILLEKMDRNENQLIEKTELHQWIVRSFSRLSKEESEERFEDADGNRDGFVTWKEYVSEEFEIDADEDEEEILKSDPEKFDEIQIMNEDKYLFQAADLNKDGKLDPEEFLAFTHPEETSRMIPHVVTQVLKEKDINKNGKIDFKEYMGDRGKDFDKEKLVEEKDHFDKDLDTDGDGSLGSKEIAAWIIPSSLDIAQEETNHLLAGSDDDHDGILSFDEILSHHDLFVGSEATDYGEQLHNIHKFSDEL